MTLTGSPTTSSLVDEMEDPVICYRCNELVELNDCTFFTPACSCSFMERCGHSVCKKCEAPLEIQVEND